ncbi:primosomal protein N' [Pasteurella bettyae]|uniref:primosomal protein N' n=1 Tax=Pasteurella bettyae TaxID=752 RepID=UPI003D2D9B70
MKFVRVALAVPLMRLFDYILPEGMNPVVGGRVQVSFGTQKRIAIVVELVDQTDIPAEQLKPILAVLDEEPLFNQALWRLLCWGAKYYQFSLGDVLFSALPAKLRTGESAVEKAKIFWKITALGESALITDQLKRAKKQFEALLALSKMPQEKANNMFSPGVWSQLKAKHFIQEVIQPVQSISWQQKLNNESIARAQQRLTLNKSQALALSQLLFQDGFVAWLLDGVTGSGKTEIYLQYIEEILKQNKQVLVLVPEISLTPQTVQRFQARFNVLIDVLHSNLNDTQRLQVWQRARTGQSAIVIGTRSALFTQFFNLGLIVIDEEHDNSFKQQDGGWRYHARDLAIVYAKQLNIPILLGSATPSLESLNNVKKGKFKHIVLSNRAGNSPVLKHEVIDLKHQLVHNGLSDALLHKMTVHLKKGNQVMLFLNRRGFAPVMLCHECGWIATCQQCDKPYTYHQNHRVLKCHHCEIQKPVPMQCPECGSTHLVTTGIGTEQLEEVLKERFPQYKITRIDRDSTSRKGALENHLDNIRQGKSQILIGTQILAKGHHFPDVTLVAIVNVDSALFSLDFRAEERLAQLYIQVAGRSGRSEKQGEVVLQTHYPEHPLLQCLLNQGYSAFADSTLNLRYQMGLPPFSGQALFRAQSKKSEEAEQILQSIANYFHQWKQRQHVPDLQILGPISAPFSKKAGRFRWQLLLQHTSKSILQKALSEFNLELENDIKSSQVRWILDVDPQDMS